MKNFLSYEHPIRFAHRGSGILWPENTMMAFQGAVDLKYKYIETDIHATKDGVLVTFHDDQLDRVTNGTGDIRDWKWEDLRKLDAAFYFKPDEGFPLRYKGISIPSLEEVMTTFSNVYFNLEIKQPGIESILAELLRRHRYEERVLVASFSDQCIQFFRKIVNNRVVTSSDVKEIRKFWLFSRIYICWKIDADVLQVPLKRKGIIVPDKKFIRAAHAVGKQVHVWTINDPLEMQKLINWGVDGIITDQPDLLNQVLKI